MGLTECLRVKPPRLLPGQDSGISARAWAVAKRYWLQPADPVATPSTIDGAAQGSNGAGPAGVNGTSTTGHSGALGSAASTHSSPVNGAEGTASNSSTTNGTSLTSPSSAPGSINGAAPSSNTSNKSGGTLQQPPAHQNGASLTNASSPGLQRMLSQALASGTQLEPPAAAAAAALLARRQQEQLKQGAVVAAVWGLSVLGGASFFADETQALVQVCGKCSAVVTKSAMCLCHCKLSLECWVKISLELSGVSPPSTTLCSVKPALLLMLATSPSLQAMCTRFLTVIPSARLPG